MPSTTLHGLPVTSVERTLLDVSPMIPPEALLKGVDSALRARLTDPEAIARLIAEQGGRGVRGATRLARTVSLLDHYGPTGSPAEVKVLKSLDRIGVSPPVLQWKVVARNGRRYRVDFGWPQLLKGVEIDGLSAHGGAARLERDLERQNDLLDLGIQLRRFPASAALQNSDDVAGQIARFLAA